MFEPLLTPEPTADPSFNPSLYSPPLSLWDKGTDFSQAEAWEQIASEVDAKDLIECKRSKSIFLSIRLKIRSRL